MQVDEIQLSTSRSGETSAKSNGKIRVEDPGGNR